MQNDESIVRYTANEIDEMARRGEDQTDCDRVRTMTDAEIEAAIDLKDEGEFDWSTARIGIPDRSGA
jgi:hypothetical protein